MKMVLLIPSLFSLIYFASTNSHACSIAFNEKAIQTELANIGIADILAINSSNKILKANISPIEVSFIEGPFANGKPTSLCPIAIIYKTRMSIQYETNNKNCNEEFNIQKNYNMEDFGSITYSILKSKDPQCTSAEKENSNT